jgi:hypothetical protein
MTKNQVFRLRIDRKGAPSLFLGDVRSPGAVLTKKAEEAQKFQDECSAFTMLQSLLHVPYSDTAMRDVKTQIFTHEETKLGIIEAVIYVEYARVFDDKPGVWTTHLRGGIRVPRN